MHPQFIEFHCWSKLLSFIYFLWFFKSVLFLLMFFNAIYRLIVSCLTDLMIFAWSELTAVNFAVVFNKLYNWNLLKLLPPLKQSKIKQVWKICYFGLCMRLFLDLFFQCLIWLLGLRNGWNWKSHRHWLSLQLYLICTSLYVYHSMVKRLI